MITFPCAKINLGLNIVSKRKDGYERNKHGTQHDKVEKLFSLILKIDKGIGGKQAGNGFEGGNGCRDQKCI